MKTSVKSEFIHEFSILMLEDPDGLVTMLWQLVRQAMVVAVMSQLRAGVQSHMGRIEQELLQTSRAEVRTHEGANPTPEGGAQVPGLRSAAATLVQTVTGNGSRSHGEGCRSSPGGGDDQAERQRG
jgi:hypothetical protein